jgi:ribonuclease HII
MITKPKYIIGVDEAGRGPLAGPVSVGVAMVPAGFDWGLIPGVNDSKKLTEKKREVIFEIAEKLQKEGKVWYSVSLVAAESIDANGIVPSITSGLQRSLKRVVEDPKQGDVEYGLYEVKLDGGLTAPKEFMHQETITKGDAKEKVIGLASIMAKVTRDRYMVRIAALPQFAPYTFETHKGYGTKKHRESIAQNGLSKEHRTSYCNNIKFLY